MQGMRTGRWASHQSWGDAFREAALPTSAHAACECIQNHRAGARRSEKGDIVVKVMKQEMSILEILMIQR